MGRNSDTVHAESNTVDSQQYYMSLPHGCSSVGSLNDRLRQDSTVTETDS